MKLKQYLPFFIVMTTFSCSYANWNHANDSNQTIIVSDIQNMPDDIEGCACYLSKDDNAFENQRHLFASSNDSTAFMTINNELVKFRLTSTTNAPFTFTSHTLIEAYTSLKYDLIIESQFEDSTRYDSWMFHGQITVKNKTGAHTQVRFVGACGC